MRAVALFSCVSAIEAFRSRHKAKESGWTTISDKTHGACAENMQHMKQDPVGFPLMCSGDASNVKILATASGSMNAKMWVKVDGEEMGERAWPVFGGTRIMETTVSSLSKGVHIVHYRSRGNIKFDKLEIVGGGSSCSLEVAPNFARDLSSYTLNGFDVLNRLFGENTSFDSFKKQQLSFASDTMGTTDDGSINSNTVAEGFWKWLYMYSQNSAPQDPWGKKPLDLWDEAKEYPPSNISLGFMPRHAGENMQVYEACNTLSNLAFHEAAIWMSCKGWPFDREEIASLVSAFNGLAAGSSFLHACACDTGGRADTFTMDWLMLQSYQSLVKQVVENAGDRLSTTERDAILYFGHNIGAATDVAKDMTRLMEGKYDHAYWNETMRSFDIPAYELPIAGVISFVLWGLQGKFPVPGLASLLENIINGLISLFGVNDADFIVNVYMPAMRKALSFSNICYEAVSPVLDHTLSFIVTFFEALIFQGKVVPVPEWIRSAVRFLDQLGFTSDRRNVMHPTWDYYNGKNCRLRSDHATWHEKAAQGLLHFLEVAEQYRINANC